MTVRDPSGGVLTIDGEGTRSGSAFCFAFRARQCLQHRCLEYLAYVVDSRVDEKRSISNSYIPVVRDFPDAFPLEFPSVPHKRQVEF